MWGSGKGRLTDSHCEASRKGSLQNCHCEGSRREPVAISIGDCFVASLLAMTEGTDPKVCHCEASRKGSRGNPNPLKECIIQKSRLPRLNANAFRLAMTEGLRLPRLNAKGVQARNDRKGEVASLLAMTIWLTPRSDNW